ncbi:MAG TPA: choice-of-anchor tandem repeat GloVer-containing protein [Candidatus Baltobacteraceae bacterium]|nr:choice-of-anchor tandem repeat GloVer-containing protein [Candidatus Baltobacteraceae bacterium]
MRMKLFCLITCAMAMTATHLTAQTFTTLYDFTSAPAPDYTNNDGASPASGLILSGNTLYGTAYRGGSSSSGTVFAVNSDGSGFTNLHSFTELFGSEGVLGTGTNSDGALSEAGLFLSGNTLYGTATEGGTNGNGTVFAVNTDGRGFTVLHTFTATFGTVGVWGTNGDGAFPEDPLILSGSTLYGTAGSGGPSGSGAVFALNTNGTSFTILHTFTATSGTKGGFGTNSEGAYPGGGLILSGNTLYGTAFHGGISGDGTVFAVNTNSMDFTTLYNFTATNDSGINGDGANPIDQLILSGNTLYGTATEGGSGGSGTVFAVNTNGTGFTTLHSFTATSGPYLENGDGAFPEDALILSGNTLYGTTHNGGSWGSGVVFAVNTNGSGFATLHVFTASAGSNGIFDIGTNSDGCIVYDALLLLGNTLYGTAFGGGTNGNGTVFSLSFPPPQLAITASDTNAILTWPTNDAGFSYSGYTLQSTTNLASPAVWTPVVPAPVVVNGQLTVTNPISGTQQFYRLSQ